MTVARDVLDAKAVSLSEYLDICSRYVTGLDKDVATRAVAAVLASGSGKPFSEADMAPMRRLEKQWYGSIMSGTPDYSVYGDPYYFVDVWNCWRTYSRKYLREVQSPKSFGNRSIVSALGNISTVLDLGCGFGYTTAALKQIFHTATVTGTNLPGTAQYEMSSKLGRDRGFTITANHENLQGTDLVWATEYFEHFPAPIEHLEHVLEHTTPRFLLIANTFTSPAIGHFETYLHKGVRYAGKQVSIGFNKTLRYRGYEKVKTKCWNNRPMLWRKL